MIIRLRTYDEHLLLHEEVRIKRPNKGMQKYRRYTSVIDLEWAKIEARKQYRERVKNQK